MASRDAERSPDKRSSSPADLTPQPGDVLAGKYRVERVIGAGGMGIVVEATHLQLGQRVALKFMTSEFRDNESVLHRFEREARAAARLDGEHVARVYDFGELRDGTPFIVMEYLEGEDLSDVLDREGTLNVQRAVDFVLQACVGIAEAHAAGIVHRDIKPANLFLSRRKDGRTVLKVLDFGISKLTQGGPQDTRLTHGREAIGSPMYMSPEQIESVRTVDHRTDVWALGTVLYELITGCPPFVADSAAKVYVKVLTEPFSPLSAARDDVPPELDAVLDQALAKAPDDRFATVADLACALEPFGSTKHAPALSTATTRIIAASRLSHDSLPAVMSSDPPPAPNRHVEAPSDAAPTDREPAVELADSMTVLDVREPAVPEPKSLQRTSAAATWEQRDGSSRTRGPVLGVVAAALVVIVSAVVAFQGREEGAVRPSEGRQVAAANETPTAPDEGDDLADEPTQPRGSAAGADSVEEAQDEAAASSADPEIDESKTLPSKTQARRPTKKPAPAAISTHTTKPGPKAAPSPSPEPVLPPAAARNAPTTTPSAPVRSEAIFRYRD